MTETSVFPDPPINDDLYVWQVFDHDDRWGIVAAAILELAGLTPLVTRNRAMAEGPFAELASSHRKVTGRPVRLARYALAEVIDPTE